MTDWPEETRKAARRHGIDPERFFRQIKLESANFAPRVISGAQKGGSGEIGIAQMMPATARGWGVNPYDPLASLDMAARQMARMMKQYGGAFGGWVKAIIGYNAGEGTIRTWNGDPSKLPRHTQTYLKTVLGPNWTIGEGIDGDDAPPGIADLPELIANLPSRIAGSIFDPDAIAATIWETIDGIRQRIRDFIVEHGKELAAKIGVPVVFGILGMALITFGLLGVALAGVGAAFRSKPGKLTRTVVSTAGGAQAKAGLAVAGAVI